MEVSKKIGFQILGCHVADEFFVFKVVRLNEFQHPIAEQVRILTIIGSPRHLVEVGSQMLSGNLMPSPMAAFRERERTIRPCWYARLRAWSCVRCAVV
jgi:hypothetical protein